jgi:acetyl esterase
MPLDPQAQRIIDATIALGLPPMEQMTPGEARESMRARTAALGPVEDVARVDDHRVRVDRGEITVRCYTPSGAGPFPALVFFHGGGWVIGDLETHDGVCRSLANGASCVVASVDYRLAPEHKYPVAVEDAFAATRWIADNAPRLGIDPRRLAVGGDSAGGNLAAAVAIMQQERGGPGLALQVLVYPVTRHGLDTDSYRKYADGYLLTRNAMRWFWDHYLRRPEDGEQPYASPLLARKLEGLPPALVITAEYDVLCDEGEAFAARLREAGVPVTLTRYPGMIHGFLRMLNLVDTARAARDEIASALRKAFGG